MIKVSRASLTNKKAESLQFMAWERSFEERVMKLRAKELSFQRKNYIIEVRSPFLCADTILIIKDLLYSHLERYTDICDTGLFLALRYLQRGDADSFSSVHIC